MNRGSVTPQPERAVSYLNPNVYVPRLEGVNGQSTLALFAAGALAGFSTSPRPLLGGSQPTATALIAGALL